jgi:hypothetical protein
MNEVDLLRQEFKRCYDELVKHREIMDKQTDLLDAVISEVDRLGYSGLGVSPFLEKIAEIRSSNCVEESKKETEK